MFTPLFWFFAALTLLFGIGVIVNRNPVASALCLVVSFMGLSALFVGLDAYLIGVLQVLVYAGAVMVLFLFIIMLLDLRAERRRKFNLLGVVGGGLVAAGFATQLLFVLSENTAGKAQFPPLRAQSEMAVTADGKLAEPADPTVATVAPLSSSAAAAIQSKRPMASVKLGEIDDVRQIGWSIFAGYNLPLQVVGVLLLVATVGVVVLSRRELK
jgi:NADH-quinone oxidoreductase subunit J